ncbi:F0F1 ATP synthase subunit B [Candidatus Sumerlaeota bacterium]|nr:F0F1 ATP synthase subunit B [Candidatus Sumerlaeota bacterium]
MGAIILENLGPISAQVISFLIFYWLLKRFAWGPVMVLLEERRKRIKGEYDKVSALQKQMEELKTDYEKRIGAIEAEARERVQEGVKEGRRVAEEIAEKARAEARERVEKSKQMIDLEMIKARKELREQIVDIAMKTSELAVRERLDRTKHDELVGRFIDELNAKN